VLEVELKYRVADPAGVVARLLALGATPAGEEVEADHYFNAPDRDFRRTDEAFRLRRAGGTNRFTYKGPKRDAATKTRTEIELPVAGGDAAAADAGRLVTALGYRPVAVVRKTRTSYELGRGDFMVVVCVDVVDQVGTFVEVEVVCEDARFDAASAAVLGLAAELGLTETERRSYLGMLIEMEEENSRKGAEKPQK
jgi:adenylate cyclase class 2